METQPAPSEVECLVVGAGPAGLTAALYLARFRRSLALVDAGDSRAEWIPTTHNYPGFPDGLSGRELLALLREQAAQYGVVLTQSRVTSLERQGERFIATLTGRRVVAHKVVLATGVEDKRPPMDDLEEAVRAGCVRFCPICDGFEVLDRKLAVYGDPALALGHARFLRTYTADLTMIVPPEAQVREADREAMATEGIALLDSPIETIRCAAGGGALACAADGSEHRFDTIYPMLGCRMRSELAIALGARCTEAGDVICNAHQETSVPGLYAAGDVVSALNQVSVATGHAAIAATDIHNKLPPNPRAETSRG